MESPTTQHARLIKELAEKITYWADKNPDYMQAYMAMLHGFTYPKEFTHPTENKERDNENPFTEQVS